MNKFPSEMYFRGTWRSYQQDALKQINQHLEDSRLHIVAAPGAGKTTLGLEIMRLLGGKTIIFVPSLTIRNQWIQRLCRGFLGTGEVPKWISTDIRSPGFVTVVTYQGLHSSLSQKKDVGEDEINDREDEIGFLDVDEDGKIEIHETHNIKQTSKKQLLEKLADTDTIIIDEAHHLRNAWRKSLIELKEQIPNAKIISLTATPPYDVEPSERKRYTTFCGPIDAEISVPELVLENNLCPHQDVVYFNSPTFDEDIVIVKFRKGVDSILESLDLDEGFRDDLLNHPYILNTEENIESILDNPEYVISMLVFLYRKHSIYLSHLVKTITGSRSQLPELDRGIYETLLQNIIYKDKFFLQKEYIAIYKAQLSTIGANNKRKIQLQQNNQLKKYLGGSVAKLESINQILSIEKSNLQSSLRMLILADFIGDNLLAEGDLSNQDLLQLNIISIFETLRRNKEKKMAVLTGSISIIHSSICELIQNKISHYDIDSVTFEEIYPNSDFVRIVVSSKNQSKLTPLLTQIFTNGDVGVLIGTKSLLGEGRDAPCVNSLILATYVGSFMLSNQMRGRAIRIDPNNPQKVSLIWHLTTIDHGDKLGGYDYSTLWRRFNCFVAPSLDGKIISSGLERLHIFNPPRSLEEVVQYNHKSLEHTDRGNIRQDWKRILENGTVNKIIHTIETEKITLPRNFMFNNTLEGLIWTGVSYGSMIAEQILRVSQRNQNISFKTIAILLGFTGLLPLGYTIKAGWLYIKNGSLEGNLDRVAHVLLKTLCEFKLIKTKFLDLSIKTSSHNGALGCYLIGATVYEQDLFLDSLEEILSPIQNPRYIISRYGLLGPLTQKDYHTVPTIIGNNKERAQYFANQRNQKIGSCILVYTRTKEGRLKLLKARTESLAAKFAARKQRKSIWQ